ncbi:hypothetical protein [Streptomyces sp. NPDC006640]|uniref:hypothetical protein n=1 Tax=unclassified Streptomyces TaxID=2593676 RepID=UPI0036987C51
MTETTPAEPGPVWRDDVLPLADRLAAIRKRHTVLAARTWETTPHQHGADGCRCMSCYDDATGWQVDHSGALDCAELVADTRNDFGRKRGSCDAGPLLSYDEADALARAADDIGFLLDLAAATVPAPAPTDDDLVRVLHELHLRDFDATEFVAEVRAVLPACSDPIECSHEAALGELAELRARVADYENRITWETTCGSCARILDSSIRETERAERAEAAVVRVRRLHDRLATETELASPDDRITRADAAERIATALDMRPASGPGRADGEPQQDECSASRSGDCLREAESETACDTEAGECVHGGKPGGETQQDETQAPVDPWSISYHRLSPARLNAAVCTCGLGPDAIIHNEPPHPFNSRLKAAHHAAVAGICTDCHHHETASCHQAAGKEA